MSSHKIDHHIQNTLVYMEVEGIEGKFHPLRRIVGFKPRCRLREPFDDLRPVQSLQIEIYHVNYREVDSVHELGRYFLCLARNASTTIANNLVHRPFSRPLSLCLFLYKQLNENESIFLIYIPYTQQRYSNHIRSSTLCIYSTNVNYVCFNSQYENWNKNGERSFKNCMRARGPLAPMLVLFSVWCAQAPRAARDLYK